jgi:hypothetical protein
MVKLYELKNIKIINTFNNCNSINSLNINCILLEYNILHKTKYLILVIFNLNF